MTDRTAVLYWSWIESEAALIESDGCTKASGFQLCCCWEHDLAFYYATDPRDAFRRWREHDDGDRAWKDAAPVTFEAANEDFRRCHAQRSRLGWWWWINPMNVWRWRAVVRAARGAWDSHRAREAQAALEQGGTS